MLNTVVDDSEMLIYFGITQSNSGSQRAQSQQKSQHHHLSTIWNAKFTTFEFKVSSTE